ncbi:5-oxoprolinase/urea amidolyase family protein [Pelomonas sp. KK5]|uniref:5-oxoprolinase subunit B/C family protein n=1 Tax=Pelomonas sp. KK5 TaxID=1855730 RepID=UPI00097BFC26|nr:5-oxoprolinase/urea amidolyase family protein [Pelomonas sp. KK5]
MRFLRAGLDAMLVELDDLARAQALWAALDAAPIAGITQIVPAARTLLLSFDRALIGFDDLARRLAELKPVEGTRPAGELVEIPVRYDGEDLAELAALLAITPEELVRRHTGAEYTVAFTGFAPGFAYLTGGHPSFDNIPRRKSPRTRIPAGAVGLAGRFSGVYPQASPGGWQLIGITDTPMWDLSRERPALLQPGQRVRFVAETEAAATPSRKPVTSRDPGSGASVFEVRRTGAQALFQDLGRAGQAAQGVSASGAMDRGALRAANRLAGNDPGAAAIEIAGGGLELLCLADTVVAITGADAAIELIDAQRRRLPASGHAPLSLAPGDTLRLAEPRAGLRNYLAVRGGFDVPAVLGSRSRDMLAGIGPAPLAVGDRLAALPGGGLVGSADTPASSPAAGETITLDVVPGPRDDWFADAAALCNQTWRVTPQSNRVGLRLEGGAPLQRRSDLASAELPSEGTIAGALQVPPSGQPVLFLADHPVTGGYPVIACVAAHHLDLAGQIPAGASIRFRVITP